MRCLEHENVEAQAVCSVCGRGLCRDCIGTTQRNQIVCSDYCLERAEAASLQRTIALDSLRAATATLSRAFPFFGIIGLVMWGSVFLMIWKHNLSEAPLGYVLYLTICVSAGCFGASGLCFGLSRRLKVLVDLADDDPK